MSLLTKIKRRRKQRKPGTDYLALFLQSRESMGVSPKTLRFYIERLSKFTRALDCGKATRHDIQQYLEQFRRW